MNKFSYFSLLLGVLLLAAFSCSQNSTSNNGTNDFGYDLSSPKQLISLPKVLKEISGITYWDKHELAGIQDEDGYIFIIDTKKEEVEDEEKFRKDGDYEDIAKVGKKLYIVRNDGTLYKVKDFDEKDQETKKYETPLSDKNDVEGLCYDQLNHRLLLLCKEEAGIDDKIEGMKAVYAFDLEKKKLDKNPVLLLPVAAVENRYQEKYGAPLLKAFKPSALDIHPKTGELYLISSVAHLLVVISPEGGLVDLHLLPASLPQPEGLAFSPSGKLYIASEGKKGKGKVAVFPYQSK